MTQKDKMLRLVLSSPVLMTHYDYEMSDINDLDINEALRSEIVIIATVARIINDLKRSSEESTQKQVYNKIFNYLNDNLLV